jgi:hypothetical protein
MKTPKWGWGKSDKNYKNYKIAKMQKEKCKKNVLYTP